MKYKTIVLLTVFSLITSSTIARSQNYFCEDYVNPRPETRDRDISRRLFSFNNLYSYNNCLDHIMLSYEGRNQYLRTLEPEKIENSCIEEIFNAVGTDLDRDQLLELIELADRRAELISVQEKLYPGYGIRRRIALQVGYVYDLDRRDPQVCSLVSSPSERY